MTSIFDGARQRTGDRSVSWYWDGPQNIDRNGELWGERVRLWARHDKTRRAFIATVARTEYATRHGYTIETFDYNARSILAVPVARYSAGAFDRFLTDVRDKAENLAAFGSEGSGGEILRHGVQLVNGTVPA